MATVQVNLTCVSITQQFDPDYWKDWDEDIIKSRSIEKILKEIINRANKVATVSEAYGIKHDKDTTKLFDSISKTFYTESIAEHGHFVLKFSKGNGTTLNELAVAIGIEPQYIEKAKSGRYAYDNLLAYLIHAKDSDKFQYSPDEVVTICGTNYLDIYREKYASWYNGKIKKQFKKASDEIELLIDDILNGKVSKDEILLSPHLLRVYGSNRTKINEAFNILGEAKAVRTKTALDNGEFKKSIIFIAGNSGLGKSTLAKELVKSVLKLARENGYEWTSVTTAGTNIFDEVNGDEILLLDDVRGDSLTASDWLKLLDPYNISPISARYQNRMGAARVIIITSSKLPLEFFHGTKGNDREDLSQYIRRFDSLVHFTKDNIPNEIRYLQASPIEVSNRRAKIPNVGAEVYLSYDFSKTNEMSKEELLEFLLATISLNNKWELDHLKSSIENQKVINASDQTNNDNRNVEQK